MKDIISTNRVVTGTYLSELNLEKALCQLA